MREYAIANRELGHAAGHVANAMMNLQRVTPDDAELAEWREAVACAASIIREASEFAERRWRDHE